MPGTRWTRRQSDGGDHR
jgi:transposase